VNNEEHAEGTITEVKFSSCGSATVTTINNDGRLTIKKGTRTVTGTGVEVTVSLFGTDCIYGLGTGTHLGTANNTTFSDEGVTRDRVTLAVKAQLLLKEGGFGCSSPAEWTANYVVTSPTESFVD